MYLFCGVLDVYSFPPSLGMVISFDRTAYFGFVNSSLQIWIMANGSGSAVINVTLTGGTFWVIIA